MSSNRSPLSAVFAIAFAVLLVTSTAFSGVVLAAGQGSVAGNVDTQEGTADDISVELTNTSSGVTYERTVSDASGAFNITGLNSGTYELVISEAIHQNYTETITLGTDENYSIGNVTLNATGDGEIYGNISTAGNQNTTTVVVENASGDVVYSENAQSVGEYSIIVTGDDGPYNMTVSAPDHETVTQSISVGSVDRTQQDFTLAEVQDGFANGTVTLENASGQNATVNLVNSDGNVTNTTEITSGGAYNFSQDPGNYTLNVTAPFHTNNSTDIELTEGNTTVTDITLDAIPESITGTVTTERNDYTGDIQVTVENSSAVTVAQQNFTGSNITYDFDVNGTETYTVYADATGYDNTSATVQINNTSEEEVQDFALQATQRGNFTITASTDDGNASGITIDIVQTDDTATVSDGGSQTFDLPTGNYDVEVSATDYETVNTSIGNTVDDSESISVTLSNSPGIANVTVSAPNADSTQNFTVTVNETGDSQTIQNGDNGTFSLAPGTYNITADATNFTTDTEEVSITSNATTDVTLNPYEPKTMNVTLNLDDTNATTSGTITVDETGNSYSVNDGDTVSITGLRQDTYTVTAEANGHVNQTSQVTVDDTGASKTFNLSSDSATGIVGITTESEDGNATSFEVNIQETGQTFTTSENETIQVELSTGNYTISADSDGYNSSTQTVEVTENSTQAVEFSLAVNQSAQVNASGQRIAGGKSLWVGQDMFREGLSNYTEVRWRNDVTGLTYDRSIDADDIYRDSVKNITDQLGSNADYTLLGVNSSGNTTSIASVFLGVQTLNTTMTPNETVDEVNVNFNSNRQSYRVIVTQDGGDTNQLNNTQIRDLFAQNGNASIETIDGTQEVVVEVTGTSYTQLLNVSDLERATYNFGFDVVDTPSQDTANVTLVVSQDDQEPDATITDDGRFWLGQDLLVDNDNVSAQETIGIYRQANNTFVQELTADQFGEVIVRTESLGVGEYYIEDDSGQQILTFSVARQTLNASWTDEEVLNGGSQTESGLTIESNRARYDLLISAQYTNASNVTENVSASDLSSAFDLNNTRTVDGTEYAVAQDLSNPETLVADFDNLSAGNYTFTVTAADAVGEDTAEITVEVPVDGQALFKEQFYTHNRGDLAKLKVEFTGDTQSTMIKIGRPNEVAYQLRANITRNSNTSEVTLIYDTSKAGRDMESQTLYAVNNTADVDVISETSLNGDRRLEDARYLMELRVDNQTTDLSTLNLFKAEFFNGNSYGVPPTVSSVGSEEVVMNESVVMDEIDGKSYVAFGYRVQGLETQLNDTNRSAAQFNPSDQFAQDTGLSFEIVKDNGGVNAESETVNAGQALAYHYVKMNNTSEENKTAMVWFVFDGSEFNENGDGIYEANFSVSEDNHFVDENKSITTNFTFVETETKFDRHWSGDLLVLDEENQTFTGTTTLPPGTTLRHEIRSDNVRFPYYEATEMVVTENQTFNATYDLTQFPIGLEFNTSIPSEMDNKSVEVVPEIQPAPAQDMTNVTVWTQVNGQSYEAEVEFTSPNLQDTTVSTDGTPANATAYMQKGTYNVNGQVQINETNYTISRPVTLEEDDVDLIVNMTQNGGNLEKADPTQKPDRYTISVRLVDENNEEIDGIVTIRGQQKVVSNGTVEYTLTEGDLTVNARSHNFEDDSRQVTLDGDKEITIQMTKRDDIATPTPDPEPTTPTQTETTGQPGFGVVISLVALLGAALLARRRQ